MSYSVLEWYCAVILAYCCSEQSHAAFESSRLWGGDTAGKQTLMNCWRGHHLIPHFAVAHYPACSDAASNGRAALKSHFCNVAHYKVRVKQAFLKDSRYNCCMTIHCPTVYSGRCPQEKKNRQKPPIVAWNLQEGVFVVKWESRTLDLGEHVSDKSMHGYKMRVTKGMPASCYVLPFQRCLCGLLATLLKYDMYFHIGDVQLWRS